MSKHHINATIVVGGVRDGLAQKSMGCLGLEVRQRVHRNPPAATDACPARPCFSHPAGRGVTGSWIHRALCVRAMPAEVKASGRREITRRRMRADW